MALYNLNEDIGERHNLAESLPEKLAEMHTILKDWRQKVGAPVPTTANPEYDAEQERQAIKKVLQQSSTKQRKRKSS